MKIRGLRKWLLVATIIGLMTGLAPATKASTIPFTHIALGSGADGVGNRLTVVGLDNLVAGGVAVAFVRLANQNGAAALVVLNCVIFDERPGPGFHFMYASGKGSDGRNFFIGVFDDAGPNRGGPYDVIYTQTAAVNGPCGVSAVTSYPIGWFPVGSGGFVVD